MTAGVKMCKDRLTCNKCGMILKSSDANLSKYI